ncbi:hypothetical protein JVT61DRAFT_14895 [Boletus reticuloceps]|uniref:Myosin motor domain-containing protein n=1 Tax=Boletus reticuloceps TaxID=495285 RepID=A0A8I2YCL4_9AGAM|nr:hypothetical protein JVT61DRAFT_14895 [Boletus reticuloceps]
MDDQACRSHKKTDLTMVEAFGKRWGNHLSLKVGLVDRSGSPTFTVNHFNGPVSYSSEGFLERNLNSLNPNFTAERAELINPFIKGLFSGKATATQAHPKNEDTTVSAQQPVRPMCAQLTHPATQGAFPDRSEVIASLSIQGSQVICDDTYSNKSAYDICPYYMPFVISECSVSILHDLFRRPRRHVHQSVTSRLFAHFESQQVHAHKSR